MTSRANAWPAATSYRSCSEITVAPNQDLSTSPEPNDAPTLARRLGLFDITMLVMGSVIGAGIFVVPHDVANLVRTAGTLVRQ